LKPQNIFVDKNSTIKILDFGLSKKRDKTMITNCGTVPYAAPEVIDG